MMGRRATARTTPEAGAAGADPHRQGAPVVAIAAMVGATVFYLAGDSLLKIATESVPVFQIIVVRSLITMVLVAAVAAATGVLGRWRDGLDRRIVMRSGFDAVTTLCFAHALAGMAIADATAIINSVPVVATVLAIVVLKERVGLARWAAILVGFAGVLMVLRPDAGGLDHYGVFACIATISVACRDVITRRLNPGTPSLIVTLASVVMVTIAGAVGAVFSGEWTALNLEEIAILVGAGASLFGAYHYSVVAVRLGEISLIGPFRYLVIVWGLVVGYIVWGDVPDLPSLFGMGLIAASGLYVLHAARRAAPRR